MGQPGWVASPLLLLPFGDLDTEVVWTRVELIHQPSCSVQEVAEKVAIMDQHMQNIARQMLGQHPRDSLILAAVLRINPQPAPQHRGEEEKNLLLASYGFEQFLHRLVIFCSEVDDAVKCTHDRNSHSPLDVRLDRRLCLSGAFS